MTLPSLGAIVFPLSMGTVFVYMTRNRERENLAGQFAQRSEHSQKNIERVLSAFIDPQNPKMSLNNFANHLTNMAVGKGTRRSHTLDDQNITQKMQQLSGQVSDARLFNETYIGHLLSESSIPGMLGSMLAMRIGSNTVSREVSLTESALEPEAIKGLLEIVGYDPEKGSGTFTSGGSMANMTALAVARKLTQAKIEKAGGTPGKMRVLTSSLAHYSVDKACDILGGPRGDIELIRVATEGLKMSPEDLEQKLQEAKKDNIPVMAVLAIAGETETGLIDPLDKIADLTEKYDTNFIADGAYGAPYRLSREKNKFKGMERAMAITFDPHKALYTPYNNGAVLFRDARDHALLNVGVAADYLQFSSDYESVLNNLRRGQGNLGEKRIEGSMSAGPILSTIAVLRTMSKSDLGVLYDLLLDRTDHLAQQLKQSTYLETLHDPELDILCFTIKPEIQKQIGISETSELAEFIETSRNELDNAKKGKGGFFFSSTKLPTDQGDKVAVYRSVIMNPRTTDEIIDNAVSGLEAIIERKITERNNVGTNGSK